MPVDLQAVFAQLHQVGHDQAALREAAALHQSLQGKDLAAQTVLRDAAVNESADLSDGVEHVDDGGEGHAEQEPRGGRKQPDQEEKPKAILRDPDLGAHVDIVT